MCSTQSLSHYCTTTGKKVGDLVLGVPGRYIMRFIASILNHIKVLLCLVCREGGEREKGKEGEREGGSTLYAQRGVISVVLYPSTSS